MAKVPCSLSVFTLDAVNLICAATQATLTIENEVEDGSCINDVYESPVVVGKRWSVSGSGPINDTFGALQKAHSDPVVAVTMTVAGGTWTGNAVVTNATGENQRRQLDKSSFTLQGQGALVWTPAS